MIFFDSPFPTSHFRAGGPRHIVSPIFEGDDGNSRDRDIGGGYINFQPIAPLPKPIITPAQRFERLGGGLTLAQLERAARFEVDQLAPIGIFFGRNLFALKLVDQEYIPPPAT